MRVVIEDILASVEAGGSLSAAFERHPDVFDDVYVSIVRAGEDSGSLDRVLEDLANFLEWKGDLRRDVAQALIYPIMVLSAVMGLVVLLATFVFPSFRNVLESARGPMPLPTQILFGLSEFLANYWWLVLVLRGNERDQLLRLGPDRVRTPALRRADAEDANSRQARPGYCTVTLLSLLPDPVQRGRRYFTNSDDPADCRGQQSPRECDCSSPERGSRGRVYRGVAGENRPVPADGHQGIPGRRDEWPA